MHGCVHACAHVGCERCGLGCHCLGNTGDQFELLRKGFWVTTSAAYESRVLEADCAEATDGGGIMKEWHWPELTCGFWAAILHDVCGCLVCHRVCPVLEKADKSRSWGFVL